ncbi:actin T1-like protein [Senna tora]|uniref:Actin T1-like protein n=1 Tax=Senna tora TaxID=362788 RepID=A0A834WGM9_9FABA|nr:actin T1-like protein [Senna tora]
MAREEPYFNSTSPFQCSDMFNDQSYWRGLGKNFIILGIYISSLENESVAIRQHIAFWHDKAMLFEQYHWKQARKKNQPYTFKWNQYMNKKLRNSYYFNWPIFFP